MGMGTGMGMGMDMANLRGAGDCECKSGWTAQAADDPPVSLLSRPSRSASVCVCDTSDVYY